MAKIRNIDFTTTFLRQKSFLAIYSGTVSTTIILERDF